MRSWILFLLLGASLTGCSDTKTVGTTVVRDEEPAVTMVDDDDPVMNEAILKGRETVGQFIDVLKAPTPAQSSFAVKKQFVDGENSEFMWVGDVSFDGTKFQGTLQNEPLSLKNVQLGQAVEIPREEVADWMYVEGGKLQGGYTIRALKQKLKGEELKIFLQQIPFEID